MISQASDVEAEAPEAELFGRKRKQKRLKSTASASGPQTYGRDTFPGENWRKILIFLTQVVKILIICNFSS